MSSVHGLKYNWVLKYNCMGFKVQLGFRLQLGSIESHTYLANLHCRA